MSKPALHVVAAGLLLLLLSWHVQAAAPTSVNLAGKFVKYLLSEQIDFPSFGSRVGQNVTETVLKELSNGSIVEFQIQFVNGSVPMDRFFPNGSMIFPYLGLMTLSNPNATSNQIRTAFNLTFIQPNTTRSAAPFTLTRQDINYNGSTYAGNRYSGRISMTINLTQAFNVSQNIPPLPINIDLNVVTFPSDLVYNLTATSVINILTSSGTAKFQMIILSTNLSLGDSLLRLTFPVALLLIISLNLLGYIIYRRRRAAKQLAKRAEEEKPDYWVH